MTTKFDVPKFFGTSEKCKVVLAGERKTVLFIRTEDGKVFSNNPDSSILNKFRFNDAHRRAWCRLSGIAFADLKEEQKKIDKISAGEARKYDLIRTRRKAEKLGYKLVKK